MNIIKLNDLEMQVEGYNKNTYLNENKIISNATCTINTNNINALHELMSDSIQTIQIYHDDTLIYNLENLNAHITNINEYLNIDHIGVSLGISFDNEEETNENSEPLEESEESIEESDLPEEP